MNRRASLSTLIGRKKNSSAKDAITVTGLEPYSGSWDYQAAAHLLRRTMYGPTKDQINTAVQQGLSATISQLLTLGAMPNNPINYDFPDDPNVPLGSEWSFQPYDETYITEIKNSRKRSLRAWTAILAYEEGISIREKMTLFWHNHFVTAQIIEPRFDFNYINKLRTNALGNFRALVKIMTIDPSMLRYLNGNQNTGVAPNENYARELLELFTIGKGPVAGPGDYTTYTEDDIVEIAKIMTGWVEHGFNNMENTDLYSAFVPDRHDTSYKQLSHRFDNIVISNADENEYSILIDIIFTKDEVARFISRQFYRWFVFYEITADIESNVIEPMAQLLIDNDYEILPVLEALLSSAHFFDEDHRGCMIKHPWDFTIGTIKQFGIVIPSNDFSQYYDTFNNIFNVPSTLGMEYFDHQNVAGWSAFYQGPAYYHLWVNSVTIPVRLLFLGVIINNGVVIQGADNAEIDFLGILNSLENPFDVNALIDEMVQIVFPKDISQNQKDYLKEVLIPGLPDFEWTVEYSEYYSDPTNQDLASSIENKVKHLFAAMLIMPEFQLC